MCVWGGLTERLFRWTGCPRARWPGLPPIPPPLQPTTLPPTPSPRTPPTHGTRARWCVRCGDWRSCCGSWQGRCGGWAMWSWQSGWRQASSASSETLSSPPRSTSSSCFTECTFNATRAERIKRGSVSAASLPPPQGCCPQRMQPARGCAVRRVRACKRDVADVTRTLLGRMQGSEGAGRGGRWGGGAAGARAGGGGACVGG